MLTNLFILLASFCLVFGSVFMLRPAAEHFGLVDRPSNRKQHAGNVPLVGGLAIYFSIIVCSFVLTPFDSHYRLYLISTSFMVLTGALDDYYDIEASLRLIGQFLIASLMVFGAGMYISDLGNLFSQGNIVMGVGGTIFTLLAVVTCINAFNMTDGVDGLVGTLSLNTFLSIGALTIVNGTMIDASLVSMLTGATVAFLFFNFGFFKQGRYKIFMGDAGSMLMGLTVIWLLTYSTQGENQILRPITAVWLIAIPLMDMFSVMIRRVIAGHSPLKASRDHLHHILLFKGYSPLQTTLLIASISTIFCFLGVMSEIFKVPEEFMLASYLFIFAAYNLCMRRYDRIMNNH